MSEEKLVPKLRFRGFDDEWNENKLIEIGEVQDGSHETPQYFEKGVPFIRLQNIERNKFIYDDIRYISPEKAKQLDRHSFCPGDILFNKLGNPIGKTTIAPKDIGKGIMVSDVVKIRPRNDFDYNFVVEYLNSPNTERKIEIEMTGSTRKRLNLGQVKNLKIIYPKKDEQHKISNFLEKMNKKIVLLENKYDSYVNFKKYLMQQIFAQKLRFDFKGEWEEKYVNEIFDITRGDVIAKTLIYDSPNEEYCYPVFSSQTTNKGIMGYYNDFDFDGEYITWTTDGANAGKTVYRNGKFKCSNVCGVLKAKSEYNGFANPFIAEYLDSITYRYVSYVGNPKLMNNIMAKIKIKYPPLEEQEKISKLFEFVDLSVDLIQNQKEMLEDFKKGLLQQMFV